MAECPHIDNPVDGNGHPIADKPHHFAPELGREVHESWVTVIKNLIDPAGKDVVDVGCGAGVYARGWLRMGARSVVGVDFDEATLAAAKDAAQPDDGSRFVLGDATATGLEDASADIVFIRAVLHHVDDLDGFAREALRLLRPGGMLIIQDWTELNLNEPGHNAYPHGYQLEFGPEVRERRAHIGLAPEAVPNALDAAGFVDTTSRHVWETRKIFPSRDVFLDAISTGEERRFIKHLDDDQITKLVADLRAALHPGEVTDQEYWTVWTALKPAAG